MKLYLDTSTPRTVLMLDNQIHIWESDRDLAKHLLKFIYDQLEANRKDWHDLSELHFFTGPGSFTGLRIGATVINTLAHELKIPIFDQDGQLLKTALPQYGKPANITTPKK
jgi:tRNA threonylcarbamoyladenosine biosynthesis protein TsaB